ncbi:MAG: excinuclease ABC subunit UvrB [Bacteroidales bacterium]|nr:excinuclease ABC subunit UvrB [Candidatus Equibacterium intestinale]
MMGQFVLKSPYSPTGDQPQAIEQLCNGFNSGLKAQTLLGVTGSGKTFTMANVIERLQRPTLILSHNKTLAAQLYGEFKSFFPDNAVEYFVSYYDYYQPEAYIPTTDTYIEKDLSINDEIEKLRLRATSALLSGRRDIIVVSSVSCLYGIGNPDDFHDSIIKLEKGMAITRNRLLYSLVDALYSRTEGEFQRGSFRVKGDVVDVFPAYGDFAIRVEFWGDEIESLEMIDPVSGATLEYLEEITIYPATNFLTTKERSKAAIAQIQDDMVARCNYFNEVGRHHEANRLKQRVEYDIEMIKEIGYCSGIENYSRYFDGRKEGQRPFCLIDYFPDDFLTFVDESHVTLPQVRGMYGGDRSRKNSLIEYGFRLPAAADNRPLKADEFNELIGQRLYVSATPGEIELVECGGVVVEQIVRPTGLLDPPIEVRPAENPVDDLLEEAQIRAEHDERTLVTTLTKAMAEDLENKLTRLGVRCRYLHCDVDTMERVEIVDDFKAGRFDVLIGVNLLREGLDIPGVSLVAILDADKEGLFRNITSLIQTAGRAARNVNGKVIFYADTISKSMQQTIDETERRRAIQMAYNKEHGITPHQVGASQGASVTDIYAQQRDAEPLGQDPVVQAMGRAQIEAMIIASRKKMEDAAAGLDFLAAARYRDEMNALKQILETK